MTDEEQQKKIKGIQLEQDEFQIRYRKNRAQLEETHDLEIKQIKNKIEENNQDKHEYQMFMRPVLDKAEQIQNKIDDSIKENSEYSIPKIFDRYQKRQHFFNKNENSLVEQKDYLNKQFNNQDEQLTDKYLKTMRKFDSQLDDLL